MSSISLSHHIFSYQFLYSVVVHLLLAVVHRPDLVRSTTEEVDIDLLHGIVKGYSNHISFLASPSPTTDRSCSARAVVRIDFSGLYNRARLTLEYDKPKLWTLDVSDSVTGDGYGGDNGTTSNMAETQIFNRQLRIYGNSLPGYLDAVIDGGLLLKVADNVISKVHKKFVLEVSDERVEWRVKNRRQFIESKFLYTLSGQNTTVGRPDRFVYVAFNRVVAGDFRSGSGLCRAMITLYADNVDRCKTGKTQCHKDAECYNTTKSYRCKCKEGFYGNGKICVDHNECDYENGGCVHTCTNSQGNYSCGCLGGFNLAKDGHNCLDNNECLLENGGCDHVCLNTVGSFHCQCHPNYYLASNGKRCIAGSNWCSEQFGCSHHCQTTASGTKCLCRSGFRLAPNGRNCTASCVSGNGGCQHRCTDRPDGPICNCHDKYSLREDGRTCTATCGVNNGGCDRRCDDTPQGPVCSCPSGFVLHTDGKTCLDIDECENGSGDCSDECVNTHGSYECVCPKGYKVNQNKRTCQDIDECSWNNTCDHLCENTNGSFTCACRDGHDLYGGTHCADKNECSVNSGGCQHSCENTEGSFRCSCHPGYRLHPNLRDCVESVKCSVLKAPAKTQLICSPVGTEDVCRISCHSASQFSTSVDSSFTTRCGSQTNFRWQHELQNVSLPSCSENVLAPGYKGRAKFLFFTEQCKVRKKSLPEFEQQLSPLLIGDTQSSCEDDHCSLTFLDLKCDNRKRKFRHLNSNNMAILMSAEFELEVKPAQPTKKCGMDCMRDENLKRLRQSMKKLRNVINDNREKFALQYEGKSHEVLKKSLRSYKPRDVCDTGQLLMDKRCVACSLATYYSISSGTCQPCPPGTYQDEEGQLDCKPCPHQLSGVGVEGAKNVLECGEACWPGSYSENGLKPCRTCPIGTYQPDYGRTLCLPCGPGILTHSTGATGFQHCIVSEKCQTGHFYSKDEQRCMPCPRDTYQPVGGQNFCIDCPGYTQTDADGATSSLNCKERTCGGKTDGEHGFIQSPNWPGLYPSNIECTWKITPEKGRRILVVVPEIHLASEDKCKDSLVMRKSASPYSLTTYETCETKETPIAFTARSRNLWIYFKTDSASNAKGFSIPYVTYNEEYQELIDDIVRDGRLYSSYQHQEVLKDKKLLSALLEVIAQPYNYFKYANVSQTMFPDSFIRLLRSKVMKFFQ